MIRTVCIAAVIELVLAAAAFVARNRDVAGEFLMALQYPGMALLWTLPEDTPAALAFTCVVLVQTLLWCALLLLGRRLGRLARPAKHGW